MAKLCGLRQAWHGVAVVTAFGPTKSTSLVYTHAGNCHGNTAEGASAASIENGSIKSLVYLFENDSGSM